MRHKLARSGREKSPTGIYTCVQESRVIAPGRSFVYIQDMNAGRKSLTLVVLVSTVGVAACSKEPTSGSACESIGRSGGIVSSADGVLSLSFRPDSISETTEVCIADAARPPNGPPNVYGQAYRVTPDIPVGVNISVTYRAPLPDDTSMAAVGVIRREDFDAGAGRWLALPITRLEPSNDLIAGTDTRVSMFYGLLADGGSGPATPGTTTGTASTGTGTGTSTGTDTPTTDATETAASEESTTGTTDSDAESDSETNDPTSDSDESTGSSESESDTGVPVDCDNLPMGPFDATLIGTVAPGNSEDLAMTGNGTFVLADGDTMVEMDADGNTTDWLTALPYDAGILGIAFDTYGNLYGSAGVNDTILRSFTPAGSTELFETNAQLLNGLFVDSDQQLWVSDSFGDNISRIDPDAGTIVEIVNSNASSANGVFFDEQRSVLYWARFAQSQIYAAQITDGAAGPSAQVVDLEGSSDGMTMDECGNLYVVDQGGLGAGAPCRIDRIELTEGGSGVVDGGVVEVAGPGDIGNSCASVQFGYGFGDANDQALFVVGTQGEVYRVDAGVGGYPITLPAG